MQILIIHDSETGNTEKMAHAVAKGVKETGSLDVAIRNVDEITNQELLEADAIIVGSPTYYGQMSNKIKSMFDKSVKIHGKLKGKVGAAFTSSGGIATGAETTLISILEAMLIHGMIIQGRSNYAHYGAAAVEEPEKQEIESCKDLGKMVASLVMMLKK